MAGRYDNGFFDVYDFQMMPVLGLVYALIATPSFLVLQNGVPVVSCVYFGRTFLNM